MLIPYLTSLAVAGLVGAARRAARSRRLARRALGPARHVRPGLELKGADKFSRANLLEASAIELDFGARYHLAQYLLGASRSGICSGSTSRPTGSARSSSITRSSTSSAACRDTATGTRRSSRLDLGLGEAEAGGEAAGRRAADRASTEADAAEPSRWPSFKPQQRRHQAAQDRVDREPAGRLGRRR